MKCPACKCEMNSLGQLPIRVGGTTGGWHLLLGNWADTRESIMPLDVYRCGTCKRVEFFDLDLSLPVQP
jgi:hypothetical protein